MKVEILLSKLKEGVNICNKIAPKVSQLPILSCLFLEAKGNFLKISSTDLEMGINWWSLAKVEKEGKIVVPSHLLTDYINFLPEEKILLEVKNQTLSLSNQKGITNIKGQPGEEFPIIPKRETEKKIKLDCQSLTKGLRQVVNFAIPSTSRPEISGIYFSFNKNQLVLAATDSFRLGEKRIFLEEENENPFSFILPQKTSHQLINIFSNFEEMHLYFFKNQIMFEALLKETPHPGLQLVSRLIEGEYPDYQEIIPQKFDSQIVLDREEFLNQVKIASLFSSRINEVKIKTDPHSQKMEISSQNPELGEYNSSLKAEIKGEKLEISFNHRFLLDGLSHLQDREIVFQLNKEKGPAVLKGLNDPSYLYLVMPIETA